MNKRNFLHNFLSFGLLIFCIGTPLVSADHDEKFNEAAGDEAVDADAIIDRDIQKLTEQFNIPLDRNNIGTILKYCRKQNDQEVDDDGKAVVTSKPKEEKRMFSPLSYLAFYAKYETIYYLISQFERLQRSVEAIKRIADSRYFYEVIAKAIESRGNSNIILNLVRDDRSYHKMVSINLLRPYILALIKNENLFILDTLHSKNNKAPTPQERFKNLDMRLHQPQLSRLIEKHEIIRLVLEDLVEVLRGKIADKGNLSEPKRTLSTFIRFYDAGGDTNLRGEKSRSLYYQLFDVKRMFQQIIEIRAGAHKQELKEIYAQVEEEIVWDKLLAATRNASQTKIPPRRNNKTDRAERKDQVNRRWRENLEEPSTAPKKGKGKRVRFASESDALDISPNPSLNEPAGNAGPAPKRQKLDTPGHELEDGEIVDAAEMQVSGEGEDHLDPTDAISSTHRHKKGKGKVKSTATEREGEEEEEEEEIPAEPQALSMPSRECSVEQYRENLIFASSETGEPQSDRVLSSGVVAMRPAQLAKKAQLIAEDDVEEEETDFSLMFHPSFQLKSHCRFAGLLCLEDAPADLILSVPRAPGANPRFCTVNDAQIPALLWLIKNQKYALFQQLINSATFCLDEESEEAHSIRVIVVKELLNKESHPTLLALLKNPSFFGSATQKALLLRKIFRSYHLGSMKDDELRQYVQDTEVFAGATHLYADRNGMRLREEIIQALIHKSQFDLLISLLKNDWFTSAQDAGLVAKQVYEKAIISRDFAMVKWIMLSGLINMEEVIVLK